MQHSLTPEWRRGAVLSSSGPTVDCFCVDRQRQVPRYPRRERRGCAVGAGQSANFPAFLAETCPLTSVADAIRNSKRNSSAQHTANSLMVATSAVGMLHGKDRGQRRRILFLSSGRRQATQVLQSFGGDDNAIKHSGLRKRRTFRGQRSRAVPLMKLQEEER